MKPPRGKRKDLPKLEREDLRLFWRLRGPCCRGHPASLPFSALTGLESGAGCFVSALVVLTAGGRTASSVGRRDRLGGSRAGLCGSFLVGLHRRPGDRVPVG